MHKNRLSRLREKMAAAGLQAMLVTNGVNRRYLTGFTGSSGTVWITASEAVLLTDFRYAEQAPLEAPDYQLMMHRPKLTETLKELAAASGVQEIGFEQADLSYATYRGYVEEMPDVRWTPVEPLVEQLRMIKGAEELRILEEAAELADRTFEHLLGWIQPGMAEREVALEIEWFMRKRGAASTSFETIVASGERSALPHGVASDRILCSGEFVKLDFGAYYRGYCSDITRTIVLGKPSERHREIYGIVLEAQQAALDGIRPGMTGREADAIARDIIRSRGYGDQFGHGTGHGLGMEIHEAPRLSLTGDIALAPGMTVTVEPGIYIPGFGGVRIEDSVAVTETGVRRLTKSSKELVCID